MQHLHYYLGTTNSHHFQVRLSWKKESDLMTLGSGLPKGHLNLRFILPYPRQLSSNVPAPLFIYLFLRYHPSFRFSSWPLQCCRDLFTRRRTRLNNLPLLT